MEETGFTAPRHPRLGETPPEPAASTNPHPHSSRGGRASRDLFAIAGITVKPCRGPRRCDADHARRIVSQLTSERFSFAALKGCLP